ncbi:type II toxin-antitoxin system HipA family toxin [Neisseriaceae bacterium TC5R-5]|nr:type II toxin-antitoxin system HipA family toxin [Neisseriaceae bacterium TC5R-5]
MSVQRLAVFYEGWGQHIHLGTLAQAGKRVIFEYSLEARHHHLELSPIHLPLSTSSFSFTDQHLGGLPGLMADSLPDGWGRLLMDRFFRANGRNLATVTILDRLAFIGHNGLGALSYQPATENELGDENLDLLKLAQDIATEIAGEEHEALAKLVKLGGSPQGARPKVLVHYHPLSRQISTQAMTGTTPWLIKFPTHAEHSEVCEIEQLYADSAREAGLNMPATHLFRLTPTFAAFGIQRFDRQHSQHIHRHSLAGLLHADYRLPSVDYRSFLRATAMLTSDMREVEEAFRRMVFNVVFHNRDDHAKNFDYLLDQYGDWHLAPAFDLTYSSGPGGQHTAAILEHGYDVPRAALKQLGMESRLSPAFIEQVIERTVSVARQFRPKAEALKIRARTITEIEADIARNIQSL